MGYLLVGIAALVASHDAASALVLHMVGYVVTNLAAFVAIIIYYNWTGREEIYEFKGLAERAPFLALCLTIALFSLAGMPLFAGFATKFILFQAAANKTSSGWPESPSFFSFVSLYYYLVVIREMYLGEPDEKTRFPTPWFEYGALAVLVAGIFFVGLYPRPIFDAVEDEHRQHLPASRRFTGSRPSTRSPNAYAFGPASAAPRSSPCLRAHRYPVVEGQAVRLARRVHDRLEVHPADARLVPVNRVLPAHLRLARWRLLPQLC